MNPRLPTIVRRQTRQRRRIYEVVASTNSHPTAEWVYEQVRRSLPRISLGTVYRNLQLLVDEGRLKAWLRGRTTRFDADVTVHDHFVCDSCGLLLDVEQMPETLAAEKKLRARGHAIEARVLEFHGFCRDCRQRAELRLHDEDRVAGARSNGRLQVRRGAITLSRGTSQQKKTPREEKDRRA